MNDTRCAHAQAIHRNGPHSRFVNEHQFALTLFVAPALLDTAYDTSLRDLRAIWRPVTGQVIAAVGTSDIDVAFACHWLAPEIPWAISITLGAIAVRLRLDQTHDVR